MKLLILGSEGFIGSNSVKYFSSLGHDVYKADIVIKEEKGYTIINPEHTDFSELFFLNQFDLCINATGSANVQFSFNNPSLDFSLNVANVYLLLDSMRKHNPRCKFINISSAAVYGNPTQLPVAEDAELLPLSPYGLHKLYSEQICKEFFSHFKIATKSLRIFSAYGEGQTKLLFYDLYKKMESVENKTISLFGTGNESRDFIHISDIMLAIECIIKHDEFDGEPINVGSGNEYKISEVVGCFLSTYNSDYTVKFNEQKKTGDPQNWCADIKKLRSLGFSAEVNIEDGIKRYVDWLKGKK